MSGVISGGQAWINHEASEATEPGLLQISQIRGLPFECYLKNFMHSVRSVRPLGFPPQFTLLRLLIASSAHHHQRQIHTSTASFISLFLNLTLAQQSAPSTTTGITQVPEYIVVKRCLKMMQLCGPLIQKV